MEMANAMGGNGSKAAVRGCGLCGAVKRIAARGLCTACYHRERRSRIRVQAGVPSRISGQQGMVLRVDFSTHLHLLEGLRQRAAKDLRSIPNQLLWELAGQHPEKSAGGTR